MKEDVLSHFGTWWAVALWIVMYGAFLLFLPFYRKCERKPATAFMAFVVAFALEMFGAPLSLYFVMWAFGQALPEGVLWGHTLSGLVGDAGVYVAILATMIGGALVVAGWSRIHRDYWSKEDGKGKLVQEGLYRHIRHPQYTGLLVISLGLLFEWATIPLAILWPILVVLYWRLARREEREMAVRFGEDWTRYAGHTGMFLPRLRRSAGRKSARGAATALAIALAAAAAPAARAQELTWESWAEAGLACSFAGGTLRPVLALDSGIKLGRIELGTHLALIPLEFGSPDLLQAGAVHYGGTIGAAFGEAGSVMPFTRVAIGGVAWEHADAQGGFDGAGAEKRLSVSIVIGAAIPLGGRWSLRPWAAWRIAPGAADFEGRGLSGPELGVATRMDWSTTLR